MPDDWATILDRLHADAAPGASAADVALFERAAGVTLTPDLRDLMLTADGAEIGSLSTRLLSLDGMREYIGRLLGGGPGARLGYIALTDSDDSNPFCVCTCGPLEGFVVRVNRDDDAEVAFRSLRNFFAALERLAAGDKDPAIDDIELDFGDDRSTRTEDDDRRAIEMLRIADALEAGDPDRLWLTLLGLQLLSARQVDVVERYLEDAAYIRAEAKDALRAMGTPDALGADARDDRALAAWVQDAVAAMRQAGIEASVSASGPGGITVNPGPIYYDANHLFPRRFDPAAVGDFVATVRRGIEDWQNRRR